jgi:Mannosyltransferase (PIG-V)
LRRSWDPSRARALGTSAGVFVATRAFVWFAGIFAVLSMAPPTPANGFTPVPPALGQTHPFATWTGGGGLDLLFSPFAQWDAGHYLLIANHGYGAVGASGPGPQAAFFPLYPLLVKGLAAVFGGSEGTVLISSYVVSLAAFFAALYFLYRLVELELGPGPARATTILLAAFPGSLYFSAPYAESVFLLCSVASFYAGRRGQWAWAAVAAGLASATRPVGLALIVPLLVLYFYGPRADAPPRTVQRRWLPRYPLRPSLLWLVLVPSGLIAYCAYLSWRFDNAFAWVDQERITFARVNSNPFVTAWDGARAAYDAVRRLSETLYGSVPVGGGFDWEHAQAAMAIFEFAVLCLALVALVGVFRRLPLAYGVYALASLLVILSTRISTSPPIDIGRPLQSLHRFVAVLFPLFIWLGLAAHKRDWVDRVAVPFAIVLGVFAAMFATRYWIV